MCLKLNHILWTWSKTIALSFIVWEQINIMCVNIYKALNLSVCFVCYVMLYGAGKILYVLAFTTLDVV